MNGWSLVLAEGKLAGLFFVAGAALFFGLGFGSLAVLPEGATRKAWIGAVSVLSFSATAVAFVLLARHLRGTEGGAWAEVASALALLGTPLLVVTMLFYGIVGAEVPAADATNSARTGGLEGALGRWSGALVTAYMFFAFLGIAAAGAAFYAWPVAPRWLAWGSLVAGLFLALTLPLKYVVGFWPGDLPLWVHVWGAVAGGWLLFVGELTG